MLPTKSLKSWVVSIVLLVVSTTSYSETIQYSVTDESWSPYWIVENKQTGGILNDIMLKVSEYVDVKLEPSRPLPVKRAQKAFRDGDIQIECCVNKAWRSAPEDAGVSLWSDTVLSVEEVLMFPVGKIFEYKKLEDLQGKSIATVRGYGYVGSEFFRRSDSKDNITQIQKVSAGRSDAGIIDRVELAYMLKNSDALKAKSVSVENGPVINRSELKVRVHSSSPELVEKINSAVAKLKEEGAIQKIVNSYIQ